MKHQHNWEINKFAGFTGTGIEEVLIICSSCGEVRLAEINRPTINNVYDARFTAEREEGRR